MRVIMGHEFMNLINCNISSFTILLVFLPFALTWI